MENSCRYISQSTKASEHRQSSSIKDIAFSCATKFLCESGEKSQVVTKMYRKR